MEEFGNMGIGREVTDNNLNGEKHLRGIQHRVDKMLEELGNMSEAEKLLTTILMVKRV